MYNNLVIDDLFNIPFVAGGMDVRKDGGLDCWGLVGEVYRRVSPLSILPPMNVSCKEESSLDIHEAYLHAAGSAGECFSLSGDIPVPSIVLIRHGDPVFVNHVGVYVGDRMFIHTRIKVGVALDSIDSPAWKRKIVGFYKLRIEGE